MSWNQQLTCHSQGFDTSYCRALGPFSAFLPVLNTEINAQSLSSLGGIAKHTSDLGMTESIVVIS